MESVLCDNAELVVIAAPSLSIATQASSTRGSEREVGEQAVEYLRSIGHPDAQRAGVSVLTAGEQKREVDGVAIANNCAVVVEHKNTLDLKGAAQAASLGSWIKKYKDSDVGGNVPALFGGKQIIVALAGTSETKNVQDRQQMDDLLEGNGVLKWVKEERFPDHDACSAGPVRGAVCDERSSTGSGAGVASCGSGGSNGGSDRGSAAWGRPLGGFFTHRPSRRRPPPPTLHRSSPAIPRRTPVPFMLRGQAVHPPAKVRNSGFPLGS